MSRPPARQIALIAVLSVVVLIAINLLVALLVFGFSVAAGMWSD
jgi:hypothetical protein